jgi:hypothetical protein
MKKAAVIIGVDKTGGGLTKLNAAASGAEALAAWARGEKFEVELITDKNNGSVSISQIKASIRKFVDPPVYSQLIIYFAGHGILGGPNLEVWLLSGAPNDTNEAVNVRSSIELARACPFAHIVFVSDACRSAPTGLLTNVVGSDIFPNRPWPNTSPEIDRFYATVPGNPAYEVPAQEAITSYRGLFTSCIIDGLTNEQEQVVEMWADPPPKRWVIPSWTLRAYLTKAVPQAAAKVSIALNQPIQVIVESHPPACLVECPAPKKRLLVEAQAPKDYNIYAPKGAVAAALEGGPKDLRMADAINRLLSAKGRESFETRTGFTIVGTNVRRAIAYNRDIDIFVENGANQVRVHGDNDAKASKSLLLEFESGSGTIVAILSGFIGTIVVEDERVVNVNYIPSRGAKFYQGYLDEIDQIERIRAYIAIAAREGIFDVKPDSAIDTANYLRQYKSLDPTLGIYAAYAYSQVGAIHSVRSVHSYMAENGPVPFDVTLLARLFPDDGNINSGNVAPFCPMLTQGWALLGPYLPRLQAEIQEARRHLVPSLWTTLQPKGLNLLRSGIKNGALK